MPKAITVLLGHVWVFHCPQSSLHNMPFCALGHISSISVCVPSHLGLWGAGHFIRQILSCLWLPVCSSAFSRVLPSESYSCHIGKWKVLIFEGGREGTKGEKSNFHPASCCHWWNVTRLLYQPSVKLLHHFTVCHLHQRVQHSVMKVNLGEEIAICWDVLAWNPHQKVAAEEPSSSASVEENASRGQFSGFGFNQGL